MIDRVRKILLPLIDTEDERRALLTYAFWDQPALRERIIYAGAANVFAANCIDVLLKHGRLTAGEHTLAQLLRTVRPQVGSDKHAEIDALIELANALDHATAPATVPRETELAYLHWLKEVELQEMNKYTPLGGGSQQRRPARMRVVCSLEPFDREQPPQPFVDAVAEIHRIKRAVLLGDPGGGKTTILWKLAERLTTAALNDPAAPIPLLISLGFWEQAEQSLPAFIAAQLDEAGELGAYLDALLAQKRAALLLDGLNELPVDQRAVKYPLVRQFIAAHRSLLAVVSCRKEDYAPHYDFDLGCDRVVVNPLDPPRIREFVERYLEDRGEALFWQLAGQTARRHYDDFIAGVGAQHESAFWLAEQPPPDLKWTYDWDTEHEHSFWPHWIKHRDARAGLMLLARNPYMLWMLTGVYAKQGELPENRGELFRLFVETLLERERIPAAERPPLIAGLAQVAYEMQRQSAPAAEDDEDGAGNARTVLPKAAVIEILGEPALRLAASASLLNLGEQVRFEHQLLQEYFAARYMQLKLSAGELDAAALWPPDRWWTRTNWEEAAILLAGLYSDDCTPVVEWLADANPEIAAQCATRSGADPLPNATRERLRAKWIPRLTEQPDPQPQARAAVGRALGLIDLDNRKGVGIVRNARGVELPDIDWVEIPDGEFQYGDASKYAAKPQRLTLPTFHLSRYPVTHAQFQTFLADPEGYANARWFEGLAADEDERRMHEQRFKFANHPRETVNWYQAMASCRWFSWRLGGGYDLRRVADWAVRLPTEFEWEKAARGTDGRLYPYAGDFDPMKSNVADTRIGQTSAVGIFPDGASPYGVEEMSGNVWEWCLSNYDRPTRDARKEKLHTDKNRVLRGGSWFDYLGNARAVYRYDNRPAYRYHYIGFRLCCVLRPPSP